MIESTTRYPGAPVKSRSTYETDFHDATPWKFLDSMEAGPLIVNGLRPPQWFFDRVKVGDVVEIISNGSIDRLYINGVEQFERSDDYTYLRSRTRICPLWVKASVIAAALALLGWVVLRSWGLA